MKPFLLFLGFLGAALPAVAVTKVATLHPILADLAQQVGGANVEVVEILKPAADVHHFEPAPKDLAEIARSTGVNIGEPLIADGTAKNAHTFETMLAHNVRSIVAALAPAAK